ncbi:MAG: hypothetical protein ACF8QF_05455 [Phycisphaerales bacterium]
MTMTQRRKAALTLSAAAILTVGLAGCGAKHYRYTDLQTSREFYAKGGKVDNERGGAVTFTDANTGRRVTLQSYERDRISKQAYKEATGGD